MRLKKLMFLIAALLMFAAPVLQATAENVAEGVISGSGTAADPFVLKGWQGLAFAAAHPSLYYKLEQDILIPASMVLSPIGSDGAPFTGGFDGAGHTVTYERMSPQARVDALFGLNYGTIQSLGVCIKAYNDAGVAPGSRYVYAAGVAAINHGTIRNCTFDGVLADGVPDQAGVLYIGGIVGQNFGLIESCYSTGSVWALDSGHNSAVHAGGIAGRNAPGGVVSNCYVTGSVSAYSSGVNAMVMAGGIVGTNDGNVEHCFCEGAPIAAGATAAGAQAYAGGIAAAGLAGSAVKGCAYVEAGDGASVSADGTLALAGLIAPGAFLGDLVMNAASADAYMNINGVRSVPLSAPNGQDGALKTSGQLAQYATFFLPAEQNGLGFQSPPWVMLEGGLPRLRSVGITARLASESGVAGALVVLDISLERAGGLMPALDSPTGVLRVTYGTASIDYPLYDGHVAASIIVQSGLASLEITYSGDKHYAGAKLSVQLSDMGGTDTGDTGTGGGQTGGRDITYSDIPAGHWAHEPVYELTKMGVVSGENGSDGAMFFPDRLITRAEFAKVIAGALNLPMDAPTAAFADYFDIPEWARPFANALFKAGYMNGRDDDGRRYFDPGSGITRAEIMQVLQNVLQLEDMGLLNFKDANSIPAWAVDAVAAVVRAGLVGGYDDGSLRPNEKSTRAQAAKMIYGMLEYKWDGAALG